MPNYCNHCQKQLSAADKICPNCGQPVAANTEFNRLSESSPELSRSKGRSKTIIGVCAATVVVMIIAIVTLCVCITKEIGGRYSGITQMSESNSDAGIIATSEDPIASMTDPIQSAEPTKPIVQLAPITAVDTNWTHTVALRSDGTVSAVIADGYDNGQANVANWTDIIAVSAGYFHTVGLKSDGTVVAAGNNSDGQCNVSGWTDIVSICTGDNYTVGLKADGTVVAAGRNEYGECDVDDLTDIIAIDAASLHTVCLKSDGTPVILGDGSWYRADGTDYVRISTGSYHTVGLRADGTVNMVLNLIDDKLVGGPFEISGWTDISAVGIGINHIVGLKDDGTVVAAGKNENGECDVSDWTDIIAISAGPFHTVGLKSDGTVVVAGVYINSGTKCDTSELNP